ncbi:dihydrofolate reductase [bacterium]|nr:dihydrofolate reductase [bacterium]MCI0565928.1 dihydrofolate reductase [bacterium]
MKDVPVVSIIVAHDRNRLIGNGDRIPWHLPKDLARFKKITLGRPIIVGRKTFETFLSLLGHPLPGRRNIVVTRDGSYAVPDGAEVARSFEDALRRASDVSEVFVVGGAEIYRHAIPYARRLYMTFVDGMFEGDTYFPMVDYGEWREISSETHPADDKNPYAHRFSIYEK